MLVCVFENLSTSIQSVTVGVEEGSADGEGAISEGVDGAEVPAEGADGDSVPAEGTVDAPVGAGCPA